MSTVRLRYYTDPACPWSWALEPALRRLMLEFGEGIELEYVMAGMRAAFQDRPQFALQALRAAEASGMPLNIRPWLEDCARSSQAAGMAVKAAAEQGDPSRYLRRLREGFFCRGHRLDTADSLLAEARAVPGLDIERFRISLSSHGVLELLGRDLELARGVDVRHHSAQEGRVRLPSLEFHGAGGPPAGVYGYADYEALRSALLRAGAQPQPVEHPSVEQALARFGTMATAELAAVCGLPGPIAPATLWRMAMEWKVTVEHCGTGELWSAQ